MRSCRVKEVIGSFTNNQVFGIWDSKSSTESIFFFSIPSPKLSSLTQNLNKTKFLLYDYLRIMN